MKLLISLIVLALFSGCDHPEGKKFERDKKVTTSFDEIESNKNNTKENSTFIEKNIDNIEITELPKVEIDNLNVLKMENQNGVKYVWIEINGIRLRFNVLCY